MKKIPKIKKNLRTFLNSEEGKISKKSVAKIGAALAVIWIALDATITHAGHSNYFHNSGAQGRHASHASHASHGSHGSHGSHASHGSF